MVEYENKMLLKCISNISKHLSNVPGRETNEIYILKCDFFKFFFMQSIPNNVLFFGKKIFLQSDKETCIKKNKFIVQCSGMQNLLLIWVRFSIILWTLIGRLFNVFWNMIGLLFFITFWLAAGYVTGYNHLWKIKFCSLKHWRGMLISKKRYHTEIK